MLRRKGSELRNARRARQTRPWARKPRTRATQPRPGPAETGPPGSSSDAHMTLRLSTSGDQSGLLEFRRIQRLEDVRPPKPPGRRCARIFQLIGATPGGEGHGQKERGTGQWSEHGSGGAVEVACAFRMVGLTSVMVCDGVTLGPATRRSRKAKDDHRLDLIRVSTYPEHTIPRKREWTEIRGEPHQRCAPQTRIQHQPDPLPEQFPGRLDPQTRPSPPSTSNLR